MNAVIVDSRYRIGYDAHGTYLVVTFIDPADDKRLSWKLRVNDIKKWCEENPHWVEFMFLFGADFIPSDQYEDYYRSNPDEAEVEFYKFYRLFLRNSPDNLSSYKEFEVPILYEENIIYLLDDDPGLSEFCEDIEKAFDAAE